MTDAERVALAYRGSVAETERRERTARSAAPPPGEGISRILLAMADRRQKNGLHNA